VLAQAYLTFVASGQISCKEDGSHHRPCAAANAAKAVTEALWEISHAGTTVQLCWLTCIGRLIFDYKDGPVLKHDQLMVANNSDMQYCFWFCYSSDAPNKANHFIQIMRIIEM